MTNLVSIANLVSTSVFSVVVWHTLTAYRVNMQNLASQYH